VPSSVHRDVWRTSCVFSISSGIHGGLSPSLLLRSLLKSGRFGAGGGEAEMDTMSFAKWLGGIGLLDATQRARAFRELALAEASVPTEHSCDASDGAVPSGEAAVVRSIVAPKTVDAGPEDLLSKIGRERLASFGCPHCGGDAVHRWGRAGGRPRYRCTNCRKTFNPLTGTPLAGLHHRDRWHDQARALINGETVAKAAGRCKVAYTTAFRWRHRFLSALNLDKPQQLSGIVEADETFILESFKGKRSGLARTARKRGGKASKRGLSAEQIPVMIARDRSGSTIDAVLPRLDAASIMGALGNVIARPAELCCDGGTAITAFARRAKITFHVLPAPGIPKPEAPQLHINNVNAYHGRLKEWLRRFHGVATKNLPNYLSWRRTIEALSSASTPRAWIMGAAGLGPYQQTSL
jgi:transposase-like protein